ncbi:uncharacterized protein F4822DRAFT_433492 [Hypoxylon trugodes]|uniref:uncharacterized protein n=1 Tax=Hypoxylon trugodes TaxID=326681 RepID=UPI002198C2A0|nr:uncharacterized protein F4822DRAFT_433492 [Hypoxylon trugodes]KAI1384956.1 hypothetical protein F4822DRAFT_433492 [Hypoxylon trugodes]
MYPGCFHPPHRGHQAVLNEAFAATQDIDVIAAFVVPVVSGILDDKTYGDQLSLTLADKTRLWTGGEPHDWLWVFEGGGPDEWECFRSQLAFLIAKDGFDVDFIYLAGPDHVGRNFISNTAWNCDHSIVGDAGRDADFIRGDGSLARLKDCERWERVELDGNAMFEKSKQAAESFLESLSFTIMGATAFEGLCTEIYEEFRNRMKRVRVCRRRRDPRRWVRFVRCGDGVKLRYSSTEIRRIIATCPLNKLLRRLRDQGAALHPELLVEIIKKQS